MRWTFICWACKAEKKMQTQVFRSHRCPQCDSAMLSCRNCRFYDPSASKECREPVAEPVYDKEKANFCEFFRAGENGSAAREAQNVEAVKKKLDDLFKF